MHLNYLPSIGYFQKLLLSPTPQLQLNDFYHRQTFRNRCEIATANGKLTLSIPTLQLDKTRKYSEVRLSYAENWQKQHWKSMESAYRRSAYFEYYEEHLRPFYVDQSWDLLYEYNFALTKVLIQLLKTGQELVLNEDIPIVGENEYPLLQPINYYQVFADRHCFVENLSIVDLLFNRGPQAKMFLDVKPM